MARKNTRTGLSFESAQDPGKDLFAYLFLMIMVFSFMLLMSMEERQGGVNRRKAPLQHLTGNEAGINRVSPAKIGRLVRKNDQLFISFEHKPYHPTKDLELLETDGRITVITGRDGKEKKRLYIADDKHDHVLLAEYLNAFQSLNQHGISVAFVERIHN